MFALSGKGEHYRLLVQNNKKRKAFNLFFANIFAKMITLSSPQKPAEEFQSSDQSANKVTTAFSLISPFWAPFEL